MDCIKFLLYEFMIRRSDGLSRAYSIFLENRTVALDMIRTILATDRTALGYGTEPVIAIPLDPPGRPFDVGLVRRFCSRLNHRLDLFVLRGEGRCNVRRSGFHLGDLLGLLKVSQISGNDPRLPQRQTLISLSHPDCGCYVLTLLKRDLLAPRGSYGRTCQDRLPCQCFLFTLFYGLF